MDLYECERLHAKISEQACKARRRSESNISCQGCVGLGESAQVPLPVQEEVVKKKKIECGRSGCGYGVKKEGDFCKKHQEPETNIVTSENELSDVIIDAKERETAAASCDAGIVDINADEITFESFEPIAETEQPTAPRLTGLSALLRTPPQPVEPDGLLIPFSREEVIALIENDVTAQDIRDLTKMLLAGELQRIAVG